MNEPRLRRAGFKPYFEREKPKFKPCVNGFLPKEPNAREDLKKRLARKMKNKRNHLHENLTNPPKKKT